MNILRPSDEDLNLRRDLEMRFDGPIPAQFKRDDEYLRREGYVLTNLEMADIYADAARRPGLSWGRRNDLVATSEWHRQEADRAAEWFFPETRIQMAAE